MRHRIRSASPVHAPDPIPLRALPSLGGPLGLALFDGLDARSCGLPVVRPVLGDPVELNLTALRDASPAERLPLGVPQWLVAGELDRILPGSHGRSYQEWARAAGDESRLHPGPRAGSLGGHRPGDACVGGGGEGRSSPPGDGRPLERWGGMAPPPGLPLRMLLSCKDFGGRDSSLRVVPFRSLVLHPGGATCRR